MEKTNFFKDNIYELIALVLTAITIAVFVILGLGTIVKAEVAKKTPEIQPEYVIEVFDTNESFAVSDFDAEVYEGKDGAIWMRSTNGKVICKVTDTTLYVYEGSVSEENLRFVTKHFSFTHNADARRTAMKGE